MDGWTRIEWRGQLWGGAGRWQGCIYASTQHLKPCWPSHICAAAALLHPACFVPIFFRPYLRLYCGKRSRPASPACSVITDSALANLVLLLLLLQTAAALVQAAAAVLVWAHQQA